MDDLTKQLREADPLPREPGLSEDEYRGMRGRILAQQTDQIAASRFPRRLSLAVALAFLVALSVISRSGDSVRVGEKAPVPSPASFSSGGGRTQVQFSTPGGTTIIWTIDPAFNLKEARR